MLEVKIPERLFQISRELKNQSDVEFYYTLKKIDTSGFISKSSLVEKVSKNCSLTVSSIYRRVSRLIKLRWVKKVKNGYRLCSYDTFFTHLGCSNSSIKKISVHQRGSVVDRSACIEIKRKLYKQSLAALNSLSRDKVYQRSFNNTRGNITERLYQVAQEELAYMVKKNREIREINRYRDASQQVESHKWCNPDITMSYERIAEFLNLSSTSQAFFLMNRLEKERLVSIERKRLVLVERDVSYYNFLSQYGDSYYRYKGRDVYSVLPNKYCFDF